MAARDADQHLRAHDRRPLHGLERPRETERLAVLDHERVREDVGERDAEAHQRHERREPPVGVPRHRDEHGPGEGGERRRQDEVALAAAAEERQEVRDEPVDRLDQPRHGRDREEGGDLPRAQAPVLERDRDRLVGQVPHALGQVDDGEEHGEPARPGGLERVETREPREHVVHSRPS
jgi:hypothetical protein